ncbi:hypothetical protein QUV83_00940 [Cellulomonas cellasea]|uniref:hypothetical protein n=1 Tax=Cellulomonas cellasea TaxID=43670 RepID=UPI0025A34971|nr:hypothetical protein [Cellulomonas cellasea]MDM8083329.1 hypothetical protein [Cellulomonas cellasea]
MTTAPSTTAPSTTAASTATRQDDPREDIEVGVLLGNGRLAGRSFCDRAEAEAWARPEEGEQVVEFNHVCECDM